MEENQISNKRPPSDFVTPKQEKRKINKTNEETPPQQLKIAP